MDAVSVMTSSTSAATNAVLSSDNTNVVTAMTNNATTTTTTTDNNNDNNNVATSPNNNGSIVSAKCMELENIYGTKYYHPLNVVLTKGEGVYLYNVEGKKYFDFLSAYSSVNQGHCHPYILKNLIEQAHKLTLCSRAFYTDVMGHCLEKLSRTFGYDRALMMNSGAEANESVYKLCRKWGYEIKKIPKGQAKIIVCNENFSGRTIACISCSTDPTCKCNFGPFVPNFIKVEYNNLEALEKEIKDPNVCAFIFEPIQGEAGIIIPSNDYIPKAFELCNRYNVLLVADEIQTGLGRTGKLLCCEHSNIKPHIVSIGKALSGGFYPISAVLSSNEIMLLLKEGEHGSTYGGNPLACSIAIAALDVIINEHLCDRAEKLGNIFLNRLKEELKDFRIIKDIRGKGLLCGIEFNPELVNIYAICDELKNNGLLTKSVHGKTIRLAPPLVITKEELQASIDIIVRVTKQFEKLLN